MSVARTVGLIVALTLWPSAQFANTPDQKDAQQLVKGAIRAMGGESLLRSINAIIQFIEKLPKTAAGKILRYKLRDPAFAMAPLKPGTVPTKM